jgi:hypothetical protein
VPESMPFWLVPEASIATLSFRADELSVALSKRVTAASVPESLPFWLVSEDLTATSSFRADEHDGHPPIPQLRRQSRA